MSWKSLVEDGDGAIAKVIAEVVEATTAAPPRSLDELADRALLRAYAEPIVPDPDDAGGAALATAFAAIDPRNVALFGGAARIGWTVAHLVEEADEACAPIDDVIVRQLDHDIPFDLISGLVGIGVYALERGAAGEAMAARVLDHLERLAQPRGGGVAWKSSPNHLPPWQREHAPNGHWDLGLAHGTPGVIGLLARFAARGMQKAPTLLDAAVKFLLDT